jgi:hypothetical protein|tara:strand:+ start:9 stop:863 length:855 start_codon:yes stop_codon:yes gene_type:complete
MTEPTKREEKANPYNQHKPWHDDGEETVFESANNVYFEDPATKNEGSEEEIKEAQKDKPYKRPNYKKRYDDLKTHYDRKLNEFKVREQELLEEATKGRPDYKAPKTAEELEQFKKRHPDVFEVVETVAHMHSEEKAKVLEERLSALQMREKDLIRKDAEKRLMENHPDFDDLRNSETFHTWAKAQPESIQSWIYNNSGDADLASRALDLFKKDAGVDSSPKKKRSNSKRSRKSAADIVSTKTTTVEPKQDKIWTEREIAAMHIDEFDKYEDDINRAVSEGRVVK